MSLFCVSQTTWGEYDSNRRLSDRISDITLWKKSLETCAEEVDTEMDALTLVGRVITLLTVESEYLYFLFSFYLHYIFLSVYFLTKDIHYYFFLYFLGQLLF